MTTRFNTVVACLGIAIRLAAQDQTATKTTPRPEKNENGAVELYFSGGTSLGFPANRAEITTTSGTVLAASPQKTALANIGVGGSVRVWRWISPFIDLNVLDPGNATASYTLGSRSLTSQVTDKNTFTVNGGVRLIRSRSSFRPYVQAGGGMLHQSGNFTTTIVSGAASQQTTTPLVGSAGSVMYGAGLQLFAAKKLGMEMGFDGFHITKKFVDTNGQNFSRFYVTLFFSTRDHLN